MPDPIPTRGEAVAHVLELCALAREHVPGMPEDTEEETLRCLRALGVTDAEIARARLPWAGE